MTMLRTLDALSRSSNLSSVAETLGLSQSAISHAVRGLTENLGEPVTVRDGRRLVLTEFGQRASKEARQALASIERLQELGREVPVRGHVTVAAVPSAASAIVPVAFSRLRRSYPKLTVDLLEGSDEEVRVWHEEGQADIAIGMDRGVNEAGLLTKDELFLVAPFDHPLADRGGAVSFQQLSGLPFVMSGSGCEPMLKGYFKREKAQLNIVAKVRDTASLLSMVAAGVGVTILPSLSLAGLPNNLKAAPLHPRIERNLWMMHRIAVPSRVHVVLDTLRCIEAQHELERAPTG